jgi:hypothetical protein
MKMWKPDSQIPMARPHAWTLAVQPITHLACVVKRGTVLLISHALSNFKWGSVLSRKSANWISPRQLTVT